MKNNWWKILGVLLIVYSFVVGMLVPLRTGISDASPASFKAGQDVTIKVEGYNSFYRKVPEELKAWLKMEGNNALAATKIEVINDRELNVDFSIPAYLPTKRKVQAFTLIVDSPSDGAAILPEGIYVTQENVDSVAADSTWINSEITHLHEKDSVTFPYRNILYETIRNLYYHVPLWFAMFILFFAAVVLSALYLNKFDNKYDQQAKALTSVGVLYGVLGLITGAIWAKHAWGAYWSWDVKQNMTAVGLLIYGAYFVLRASFEDPEKRARISAVYNIFAFATLIPLLYVVPRLTDSLHPGAGGNIAFGSQDLDNTMRMVFYPAIIGWTLFGVWVSHLVYRFNRVKEHYLENS
ncbi:MAG: cytochrome c biogenesis protein CcsA [Bacteroidota bacterium]